MATVATMRQGWGVLSQDGQIVITTHPCSPQKTGIPTKSPPKCQNASPPRLQTAAGSPCPPAAWPIYPDIFTHNKARTDLADLGVIIDAVAADPKMEFRTYEITTAGGTHPHHAVVDRTGNDLPDDIAGSREMTVREMLALKALASPRCSVNAMNRFGIAMREKYRAELEAAAQ